jgi:hypothetical protein
MVYTYMYLSSQPPIDRVRNCSDPGSCRMEPGCINMKISRWLLVAWLRGLKPHPHLRSSIWLQLRHPSICQYYQYTRRSSHTIIFSFDVVDLTERAIQLSYFADMGCIGCWRTLYVTSLLVLVEGVMPS